MKNYFSKVLAACLFLFLFLGCRTATDMADAAQNQDMVVWICSRCNKSARIYEGNRPGPHIMGSCIKAYEQTGHNWIRRGFVTSPVDNYLTGTTSGAIAGTSFQFTDLTFTESSAGVRIRNNGLNAHFSAELHVVDDRGGVVMEFGPLEGNIPGWGVTQFVAKPPYPRIHRHEKGNYRALWLNIKITPETN